MFAHHCVVNGIHLCDEPSFPGASPLPHLETAKAYPMLEAEASVALNGAGLIEDSSGVSSGGHYVELPANETITLDEQIDVTGSNAVALVRSTSGQNEAFELTVSIGGGTNARVSTGNVSTDYRWRTLALPSRPLPATAIELENTGSDSLDIDVLYLTPTTLDRLSFDNSSIDDVAGSIDDDGTLYYNAYYDTGIAGSDQSVVLDPNNAFPTGCNAGHVEIPDSDEISPTDAMTIAVWVKNGQWDRVDSMVFLKKSHITSFRLETGSYGDELVFHLADGDDGETFTGPFGVSENEWHHVAVVVDTTSGGVRMYVDGDAIATETTSLGAILDNAGPLFIGKLDATDCTNNYEGWLQNVQIHARALSEPEIENLITCELGGSCYWGP